MRKCEKKFFFVKILIPLHCIWPRTHGEVMPCCEPPAVYTVTTLNYVNNKNLTKSNIKFK